MENAATGWLVQENVFAREASKELPVNCACKASMAPTARVSKQGQVHKNHTYLHNHHVVDSNYPLKWLM